MHSKENIAFLISSTGWGGLEMNVLKLAQGLNIKYNIYLITTNESTVFKNKKNIFNDYLAFKKIRKYFDFRKAYQIAKYLKEKKINKIFCFDNKDIDVLTWSKKIFFKNLKIVYQQHMQIGLNKKDFFHNLRYRSLSKWITPLNFLKEETIQRTSIDKNKIEIIPIGIDHKNFLNQKRKMSPNKIKITGKKNVVLMGIIGRITQKKGQFFLVKALHGLMENFPNLELLIWGSPTVNDDESQKHFDEIKKYIYENQLNNKIYFHEHSQNVNLFYSSIDIFVMATDHETYGMVTIEAMMSKIPIIASNSGGTTELLQNGKYGLLYKPNDQKDFSIQLKKIIGNKKLQKKLSDEAYSYALEYYCLDVEVNKIHQLIQDL